jgi:hypothetical protein
MPRIAKKKISPELDLAFKVLYCPLEENDAEAKTIKEFLIALLIALWKDPIEFSGKRPFGNSSWSQPIAIALIKRKIIQGVIDEDGYVESMDDEAFDKVMLAAIKVL